MGQKKKTHQKKCFMCQKSTPAVTNLKEWPPWWCLDHRELKRASPCLANFLNPQLTWHREHTHTHIKWGTICYSTWLRRSGENFLCYAVTPVKIRRHQHDCKSSKCRHFYNANARGQTGCTFPGHNAWLVVSQRQSQLSCLCERRLFHCLDKTTCSLLGTLGSSSPNLSLDMDS